MQRVNPIARSGRAVMVAFGLGLLATAGPLAPACAQEINGTLSDTPGDFTFRRIAAPPKGTAPKITVQIDPEEQAAAMRAAAWGPPERSPETADAQDTPARVAAPGAWDWFWQGVSPAVTDAGPANVARALSTLEGNADAPAPRLQALADIAAAYGPQILMATIDTQVSPALVLALISVESSGQAGATSGAGARGLMQLIPDTAARFGVEDITDPVQNIQGGVAYLDWLLTKFDRDPILALAGYNAGENAVSRAGGVPDFAETRAYVPKVLSAWRVARGLCKTPPQLIGDGCVFAVQG